MFHEVLSIARREGLDAARDRRALLAAFAYAAFGPVVLSVVLSAMARDEMAEPARLVQVANPDDAPALVKHLVADGFELVDQAAVELKVPDDFTAHVSTGRPVTLTARLEVAGNERELEALRDSVLGWGDTLRSQRLLARGVSPASIRPVRLNVADLGELSARGQAVMLMLVLFLILAPFFASTSVAIDATSGERERGSLEALLALPARAGSTIIGKWLVTAAVALIGTALTVAVGALVINRAPLADIGVGLFIDTPTAIASIAVLTPLALLVAAVQILIALAARSFKEGQTYLTLFSFLPVFVGLLAMRSDMPVHAGIPVLGEMKLLEQTLATGTIDTNSLGLTVVSYCLAIAAALMAATWRIGHENILAAG